MPHYDYQCADCGRFELWQSIRDRALEACPTCGAKVERLISAGIGFVLKGSGFYQNDSKSAPVPDPPPAAGPGCGACGGPDPCPNGN
ncbi:MAG TPA: FmdB family zinc ribbon protein [bacterium]|nr:FmdB family zinc ribbon protein [bacterium]